MKILFVSSGNSIKGISPVVKNQAESLIKYNYQIKVDYFPVEGKGIKNYLKNSFKLSKYLNENKYDLIHAHYTLSGYVAVLSKPKIPIVLSVMGGDAYMGLPYSIINRLLISKKISHTILKSAHLKNILNLHNKFTIVPNGVELSKFTPIEKGKAKEQLRLEQNKNYVLFATDPERHEKNYELAKKAFNEIKNDKLELLIVHGKPNEIMHLYYSASDVLLFTSYREGSPNVIKESMSCNLPIVSTNVGDVQWIIDETEGCYLTSFEVKETVEKLTNALNFASKKNRTNGRDRIKTLNLDSESISERILNIYRGLFDCK